MRTSLISGSIDRRRTVGVALAAGTALVSGFAVFINGYGVRAVAGTADPTTYTTLKNMAAAAVLVLVAVAMAARGRRGVVRRPTTMRQVAGLSVVAVLGGALAFGLFFEGLARAASTQAALIHKTLVIWVAILAVGMLRERIRPIHLAAMALLVVGQVVMVGGIGSVAFGMGELMLLAATLLWSVEVVVAKRLLEDLPPMTVGIARMAGGALVLVLYGVLGGGLAAIGALSAGQWGWILVAGLCLAAYVGTWYAALALAPAVDVTAVLVGGAVVTAFLQSGVDGLPIRSPLGVALVAAGTVVAIGAGLGSRRRSATTGVEVPS